MRHQDLSQSWELFLAERPSLKEQYDAWLALHPDIPRRMRSHREHFIKTVGLTDADRDAWLSLGVQAPQSRLSWIEAGSSWGQVPEMPPVAAASHEDAADALQQLPAGDSVSREISEDRAA